MAPHGSRYHVPDRHLIWREWDDEHVIYHRASGETHLLNAVAAATLRALERSALTLDELCERIAAEFHADTPEAYRASLASLLTYFDDLGLIRTASRS